MEAREESESRSRHSTMASSESRASGGEDDDVVGGGHVQSSRSLERICCLAVRTASSFAFDVASLLVVALGWRSDVWLLEREEVS